MSDAEKMPEMSTTEETMEGGKRSAWMAHVKKTMRANKGKSLKQVLKLAGKTYKKSGKKTARKTRRGKKFLGMFGGAGGMGPSTTEGAAGVSGSMSGGRRRGSRKH